MKKIDWKKPIQSIGGSPGVLLHDNYLSLYAPDCIYMVGFLNESGQLKGWQNVDQYGRGRRVGSQLRDFDVINVKEKKAKTVWLIRLARAPYSDPWTTPVKPTDPAYEILAEHTFEWEE